MVVPMLRPDVFGALASHAGDALFECCYLPAFRDVARSLRDNFEGSYEVFFERLAAADHFDFAEYGDPFEMYGYASAYSPDLTAPGRALLPFEISTGRLIDDVWALWLEHDPVRMAPRHADALRSMHRIYLDAGKADEYYLDLGAQAFAAGAVEDRRRAHDRAVRRQARRHHLSLSRGDPRARDRASGMTATAEARSSRSRGRARSRTWSAGASCTRVSSSSCACGGSRRSTEAERVPGDDGRRGAGGRRSDVRRPTVRSPACRSRSRTTCRSPASR